MTEILVKISKLKVCMSEVPLVLRYDQKAGVTKMKVGRTVVSTLKLLIRLRFGESGRIPRATRQMVE
jgi:hypothetical protein